MNYCLTYQKYFKIKHGFVILYILLKKKKINICSYLVIYIFFKVVQVGTRKFFTKIVKMLTLKQVLQVQHLQQIKHVTSLLNRDQWIAVQSLNQVWVAVRLYERDGQVTAQVYERTATRLRTFYNLLKVVTRSHTTYWRGNHLIAHNII